jgi:hypothetical protein
MPNEPADLKTTEGAAATGCGDDALPGSAEQWREAAERAFPRSPTPRQQAMSVAWRNLILAATAWEAHMDQFDKVAIQLTDGPIYLSIGRAAEHPAAFDPVNAYGEPAT